MFSLKFKSFSWRDNGVKYFFIVTCIPVIAFMGISGFAVVITWYVVLSMITAISSKSKEND
jgi:CDP-diacylglycerol--serine O-phosphatidyltransferase